MNALNFSTTKLDIDVTWDDDNNTPLDIANAISKALTEKVKDETYFEQYAVYQNTDYSDDDSQAKLIKAVKDGHEEHQKYLNEHPEYQDGPKNFILQELEQQFDEIRNSPSDAAFDDFDGTYQEDLAESLIQALDELEDEQGISKDEVLDSLCQWTECGEESLHEHLGYIVVDAIAEKDTSTIKDILPCFDKITMLYTTIENDNMHDSMVECRNNTGDPATVVPDHKLEAFLTMINMPPANFVQAAKDFYDVDYLSEDVEDHQEWQALLDKPLKDLGINPKRKSAISADMALEIIENMPSNYGLPTVGINFTADELINLDPSKHLLITEGAQLGIHDYVNGAGHMENPTGPIVLPLRLDQWHQMDGPESLAHFDFNDCYGICKSAFNATFKSVQLEKSPQLEMDGLDGKSF